MMTITVRQPGDLLALAGADLGTSDWLEIPQADIDLFARATHDEQWIHVDVDRAAAGPFGGTIAHGYLTLALLIPLWSQILVIENLGMAVNYGLNKVRFPAPVPAGARVRLRASLAEATDLGGGTVQVLADGTMEREGGGKPACVAQMIYRYLPPAV
jgi:acyl dehydratase